MNLNCEKRIFFQNFGCTKFSMNSSKELHNSTVSCCKIVNINIFNVCLIKNLEQTSENQLERFNCWDFEKT